MKIISLFSLSIFILMSACGEKGDTLVTVKMQSSLVSGTSTSDININDTQGDTDGGDEDGDGALTRYISPSSFKVAFKSLTFLTDDGDEFEAIVDTGTLVNSEVLDLSQVVTVTNAQSLPTNNYTKYRAEIYYYEIVMPINISPELTQTIRLYMSDDDFTSEGNLKHHQGDIVFVDTNGDELGWVPAGDEWIESKLHAITGLRPDYSGAGGTDAETGHKRGLFGDANLWNREEFEQGANQDIFISEGDLDLDLSDGNASTVTFTFDISNTWFYEDFDSNEKFNPCQDGGGLEACSSGAEWSPIFNDPNISIEETTDDSGDPTQI